MRESERTEGTKKQETKTERDKRKGEREER